MAGRTSSTSWGDRAVTFLNRLTHTGDHAGHPFRLRPWQETIVRKLLGTLKENGQRQYRRAFLGLPRKQGKTELAAGLLVYGLLGQGKRDQHIYTAAGDRAQASLVFRAAASMIESDPVLSKLCTVYHGYKRIQCHSTNSFYEALSSEAPLKHGLSPSWVIFDELHVLPDRELFNALTTGFGARKEPLTLMITTAGWDRNSLCWEQWDYARKVRDGVVKDDTFLPILYEANATDAWDDEDVWHRVMPALGDFCELDFIREECERAKRIPRLENTFRQLYLNQWTQQATRWISMDRWAACNAAPDIPPGSLVFGGLDLSQTRDLTAFVLVHPRGNEWHVECRFWAPEDGCWKDEDVSRDLYQTWHRQGFLTLTPGDVIDYQYIENEILDISQTYQLERVFADRAMAVHLCLRLRDTHDIDVQFLPQTPMGLNGPTRELERLVISGAVKHGDNPVLNYCAANAAVKENATGLISLHKALSTGRIDGMAALVNAIAAANAVAEDEPSVYRDRGVLFL